MTDPAAWTAQQANDALAALRRAIVKRDSVTAARDREVAEAELRHEAAIAATAGDVEEIEKQIEAYFTAQRAVLCEGDAKSYALPNGTIGTRSAPEPALAPLDASWTWKKIADKLRRGFKAKYFHKPKPPEIDKRRVKADLSEEQLTKFGMRLDRKETFYIDLAPEAR